MTISVFIVLLLPCWFDKQMYVQSLRSTGTSRLLVPPVKRSTVGSHAFPVAGPKTWNALPEDVTSS